MRKLALISMLGFGLYGAGAAVAAETLADELANGFYSRINLLGYDLYQDVEQSLLNPGNVLGIAHNEAELQFRPDFNLKWKKFEFDLKPRFQTARAWRTPAPSRERCVATFPSSTRASCAFSPTRAGTVPSSMKARCAFSPASGWC